MDLFLIGCDNYSCEIESILDEEFNLLNFEYNIDRDIEKIGNTHFIKYYTEDTLVHNYKNILIDKITLTLSKIIIEIYQKSIINKVTNNMCYYLDINEKERIKDKALEILKDEELSKEAYYDICEKEKIEKTIRNYLIENNEIILEGFINFRLRFLLYKVEAVVEKLLAEFLLEKEYNEFIKILQYFVEIQEPKIELVNIVIKKDNKYLLYDRDNNFINNDYLEEIVDEMSENDMNYNDLLISSLITIAPKKIVLHIDENLINKDIIQIIKNVFMDKVSICNECKLCKNKRDVKNIIKQ